MLKIIKDEQLLRQVAKPVSAITSEVINFGTQMMATMIANQGIGLAAPQVGDDRRIITVFTEDFQGVLINPEILESSAAKSLYREGCLSFPDVFLDIKRPSSIVVRWIDGRSRGSGCVRKVKVSGITARCILHEIDHLNGVLFIDRREK